MTDQGKSNFDGVIACLTTKPRKDHVSHGWRQDLWFHCRTFVDYMNYMICTNFFGRRFCVRNIENSRGEFAGALTVSGRACASGRTHTSPLGHQFGDSISHDLNFNCGFIV